MLPLSHTAKDKAVQVCLILNPGLFRLDHKVYHGRAGSIAGRAGSIAGGAGLKSDEGYGCMSTHQTTTLHRISG